MSRIAFRHMDDVTLCPDTMSGIAFRGHAESKVYAKGNVIQCLCRQLLPSEGHVILIDVGAFGVRGELAKRLAARGVSADAVTDVVLTHAR